MLVEGNVTLHELVAPITTVPQVLVNVRAGRRILETSPVRGAIADGEAELAGSGRLFVRPSGTEPLIRVMAEGDDRQQVERVAAGVAAAIEKEKERGTETTGA
jgi:phosphoglucosamine mutase